MPKRPYATTYHRDHSATVWDVYTQSWQRYYQHPSDAVLASLSDRERERVMRHVPARADVPARTDIPVRAADVDAEVAQ